MNVYHLATGMSDAKRQLLLKTFMKNRSNGYSLLRMFKNGKYMFLFYEPSLIHILFIATPGLRAELISCITNLDPVEILSEKAPSVIVGNILHSCTLEEFDKLSKWVLLKLEILMMNKAAGYHIFIMFTSGTIEIIPFLSFIKIIGSPQMRSKLLSSIVNLSVNFMLSDQNACDTINNIIQNESCTAIELEKMFFWILPELVAFLSNRTARFAVFNLFSKGKNRTAVGFYSPLVGSIEIRSKTLEYIVKSDTVQTLSNRRACEIIGNILSMDRAQILNLKSYSIGFYRNWAPF